MRRKKNSIQKNIKWILIKTDDDDDHNEMLCMCIKFYKTKKKKYLNPPPCNLQNEMRKLHTEIISKLCISVRNYRNKMINIYKFIAT